MIGGGVGRKLLVVNYDLIEQDPPPGFLVTQPLQPERQTKRYPGKVAQRERGEVASVPRGGVVRY